MYLYFEIAPKENQQPAGGFFFLEPSHVNLTRVVVNTWLKNEEFCYCSFSAQKTQIGLLKYDEKKNQR